jgi:hypothetical protein
MRKSVLLGLGRTMLPIPSAIWRRHVRGGTHLDFMSEEHHRVREFVVKELPLVAEPLSPGTIAERLNLPQERVVRLLDDLERHMTFLFRNDRGAVTWAYPVTVEQTPHHMSFSTGERVDAA